MSDRIPRLEFDDLETGLAEVLRPRVERLGYLGELFQCAGHAPKVLQNFMQMTEELKQAVPDNLTETVALTIATQTENIYERNQHERLSRRLGYDLDWIAEVNACDPEEALHMSDDEIAAQKYALAAFKTFGNDVAQEFDVLIDEVGHAVAVALAMAVGRCITHAITVNTLELAPPAPSVFDQDVE